MIVALFKICGGIALFYYGLRLIDESAKFHSQTALLKTIEKRMRTPLGAFSVGVVVSACLQSSVATNMLAVGLVQTKAVGFISAAYAIIGANVGTTVTSQLISFSDFATAFLGGFMLIIGLLTDFCKSMTVKAFGKTLVSTGIILTAIGIISGEATTLSETKIFKAMFTSEREWMLLLNGFALTALAQSSSLVTGVLIAFAKSGAVSFYGSAFMIAGANIGSAVPVAIMSLKKDDEARRAAFFNLWFNALSALIFYPFLLFFGRGFENIFAAKGAARGIANFNTIINLVPAGLSLVAYPIICKMKNRR